uniref:RBR-type E3 ubiquitin transferase n=1 Tax=Rhabditophanes sp. KR3021 TaxID=114890 RepID=A0AC35UF80_9BILA
MSDQGLSSDYEDDYDDDYYKDNIIDIDEDQVVDITRRAQENENAVYNIISRAACKDMAKGIAVKVLTESGSILPEEDVVSLLAFYKFDYGLVVEGLIRKEVGFGGGYLVEPQIGKSTFDSELCKTLMASSPFYELCTCCFEAAKDIDIVTSPCGNNHRYCKGCWYSYFSTQIKQNGTVKIHCMEPNCKKICSRIFIQKVIMGVPDVDDDLINMYQLLEENEIIESHPDLKHCPGVNCDMVVMATTEQEPLRAQCNKCKEEFCVNCCLQYHAPATCEMMRNWLMKSTDDSETQNFFSAKTKKCPNCSIAILKAQGCNHMQCSVCKHNFCWMCLENWEKHKGSFYECLKYQENKDRLPDDSVVQAKRAKINLDKYLFYFSRYHNHLLSRELEVEFEANLKIKIEQKIANKEGTWIDWEYLKDGADLLLRARYTLIYTYVFAYYMEVGIHKSLFENHQKNLEQMVEELAWVLENSKTTTRSEITQAMTITEKYRQIMLEKYVGATSVSLNSTTN